MKTIYLAGQMKGKPNLNEDAFSMWQDVLENKDWTVLNPHHFGHKVDGPIRNIATVDLMKLIHQADAIAMIPGWEHSNGAVAEHAVALWIGLPVIYL